MNFKEIDKDTDNRLWTILIVVILTGISVYFIMKSDIKTTDMAMYWASYGTVLQAVFAAFQAIFAGIIIIITRSLATKQAALAIQQNRIVEEQKEMTRQQINLSLYEKRYKIYRKCLEFMNQFGNNDFNFQDIKDKKEEYQSRVRKADSQFYAETIEKEFLFDDKLVDYINYIQTMVRELATISSNEGIEKVEERSQEIRDELSNVKDKFKPYLDFKKI